jgi:hypothetical protein
MIAERRKCILKVSKLRLVKPDGGFLQIKYLYNPANNGRFDLTDYDPDDFMLSSEIQNAARRLGIQLP